MFSFGLTFEDLYTRSGLIKVDAAFTGELKNTDGDIYKRLMIGRTNPGSLSHKDHSQLLMDLAPHLEDFIGALFGIQTEISELAAKHHALAPIYACKRLFVQRRAAKALKPEEAARIDGPMLLALLPLVAADDAHFELVFAKVVMGWLEQEERHTSLLEMAARYAAWALYSEAGRAKHGKGILFRQPKKINPEHLIEIETELRDGVRVATLPKAHLRARHGFALTDDAGHLQQALDAAHYCIFCHHQGKDSCAKGLKEKDGSFKKNTLDITLAGCPLEEKISEVNELKANGIAVGALAMVTVDNPMCAGTGHRICNDCMKSCIYQKQEPVNIPLVETHVLKDVLALPYGFEIYSLLTRWNPLNLARPIPRADSGYKILVAGLGPAGYTLAHYLLNDGHTVVGIDGLKIEPLPEALAGKYFAPIKDISSLYEALDERSLAGFGGVAEYGITVRWDKNFLKIIRLLLERREQFSLFGGVRFGSSITYGNAFAMGFDHVALCMGAGRPTLIDMPNGLARGVRTASDFLMALQLTGAAKKDSIANLQIRLPIVVIGGGLTAIDAATEALAYYPVQVEKFLSRYEMLAAERGEAAVCAGWDEEEKIIAEEFISHAKQLREERKKPQPDIFSLLDRWGGVKLIYRKRLIDAPSYRLNHEEVEKALEEGIFIAEQVEPIGVEVDKWGHASAIQLRTTNHEPRTTTLLARTILLAAGTNPNTVLQREDPGHFELDGKYFRAIDINGNVVSPERSAKPKTPQVLLSVDAAGRAVSFFGDLHPSYAGNVVKAMASAKQGYPVVTAVLEKRRQKTLPLQGGGQGGGRFRDNDPELIVKARALRKNLTAAEKKLWQYLSRKQLDGCHFRRQHPIGNYIVDFMCTEKVLVIELDGGQHAEQQEYDQRRTQFLESKGYRVLRFWNHEVMENMEGVWIAIKEALDSTPTLPSPLQGEGNFLSFIGDQLRATVHDVKRLTPTIVEVIIHAPLAAKAFQPGQFYRLQNFEAHALRLTTDDWRLTTTLAMEGLAMTGAWVDRKRGLVALIVLEMGGSSDLCAYLKPGEPVVLMGPTGAPTHIPKQEHVLLAGGGLGNAVLFSIGKAMRENGCKVLYFAGYKKAADRYKMEEIEAAADQVVWCCDEMLLSKNRPQDSSFHGTIVEGMCAYGANELKNWRNEELKNNNASVPQFFNSSIPLSSITHLIAIGSDRMMEAVAQARHHQLKPFLNPKHTAIGSINSPMQCMMKEICAQCLQKHIDPVTGKETYVYSCFNQDQPLDAVAFAHLNERLKQNSLQEKLTALWIKYCLNIIKNNEASTR